MPKVGVTKATKSFTITMSHLAWLDEYCIKKNKKMSAVINELINDKRKQVEKQEPTEYWCMSCSDNTIRTMENSKPVCVKCNTVDDALLRAMTQYQL
jgi:Zn finger protein HypA/HybF involved in hydrogenase expression